MDIIFAVTSPLAILWSFVLWDNTLLILTSALVLYLGCRPTGPSLGREFAIGLLLGISLAIHLQAIPFVVGIVCWRIAIAKRLGSVVALAGGAALAVLPYAFGLLQVRRQLTLSLRSGHTEPVGEPLALVTSLLGFWGAHSRVALSFGPRPYAVTAAAALRGVTSAVAVVLVMLIAWYLARRALQRELALASPSTALMLCALCYVPFALITNSASTGGHYRAQAIWWFAPVAIPVAMLGLWPRAGPLALVTLVAVNLVASAGEIRFMLSETTPVRLARWRVVEQVAEELCGAVNTTRQEKATAIVTVRALPRIWYIQGTLPNLLGAKYRECLAQIAWAPSEEGVYDLRVEPSADMRPFVVRKP
jgi:hypothetical protein